jgi:hypothetical protein
MSRLRPLFALPIVSLLLLAACSSGNGTPKPQPSVAPGALSVCAPNPAPAATNLKPTDFGFRQLDQPKAAQTYKSPLTISGRANPFEGAFSVTLFDAAGKQIAGQNYNKDNQNLAFSVTLPFSVSAPVQACVWIHERSGKDGSPTNVTQVPVQLMP